MLNELHATVKAARQCNGILVPVEIEVDSSERQRPVLEYLQIVDEQSWRLLLSRQRVHTARQCLDATIQLSSAF